jgi:putative tributyrin esterase
VRPRLALFIFVWTLLAVGCRRHESPPPPDHPRLTPSVRMQDVAFYSSSLQRQMPYRVVLPAKVLPDEKFPVVYLLHGGGGGYRDWSNYSDVARLAEQGFILVMPEGASSYYVNAVERPQDRYEDYITKDLITEVQDRFPALTHRQSRAIVGVSMGGFGAVTLALKHPDLYAFVGGISSALDVPSRQFSIKRIAQYHGHAQIFGSWGSDTRRASDPYVLAKSVDPLNAPYLFLTCGEQEGLLPANERFARLMKHRGFQYEFHPGPGGHDWNQWNGKLPQLFDSLLQHVTPRTVISGLR